MKRFIANFIFISMCGAIALALTGCTNKSPLEETLLKYMAHIPEQEYEEMYEMIDVDASKSIDKEKFIERNSNIYEGIEVKNFKVEIVRVDKKKPAVQYKTSFDTIAGEISFENTADFVETTDKEYKLVWKDALIVPDLRAADKVKVYTDKAVRGQILDRNDYVLAGLGEAFSAGVVPGKLENKEDAISRLAEILEMDATDIQRKMSEKWVKSDLFVPLRLLSFEEKEALIEDLLAVPGVMIKTQYVRSYPLGESAAQLVGGVEALYEEELRGKDGYRIEIVGSDGNSKNILASSGVQHGKDIKLTIDSFLQQALYEKFQGDRSCSVAMNPKTGEVLALVGTPVSDKSPILKMTEEEWKILNDRENQLLESSEKVFGIWIENVFSKAVAEKVLAEMKGEENSNQVSYEDGILVEKEGNVEVDSLKKEVSWVVGKTTGRTSKPILIASMVEEATNIGGSRYIWEKVHAALNQW